MPVAVGEVIGLSIVTIGIYGVIRFYQVCKRYLDMQPKNDSNFEALFWTWIGIQLVGVLTLGIGIGVLAILASIAIGAVILSDIIAVRSSALKAHGIDLPLTSAGTHIALWVVGSLLSFVLVGIPILVYQAVRFFQDNERIVSAWASPQDVQAN